MGNFAIAASEYMSSPIRMVDEKTPAEDAERLMTEHSISALGVSRNGELIGVVSRTDLLSSSSAEPGETFRVSDEPVSGSMTPDPVIVSDDTPLSEIAKIMLKNRIHRVFVEEGGKPTGVVSTKDLMRAVFEQRVRTPISEIATKSIVRVKPDDSLSLAVDRLEASNKHGLIVADDKWPLGTFSQADALISRAMDPRTPIEDVMNPRILVVPANLPMHRAAHQALTMNVRRIILVDDGVAGIASTYDFARVVK
jgi:CBS domain-containing protein